MFINKFTENKEWTEYINLLNSMSHPLNHIVSEIANGKFPVHYYVDIVEQYTHKRIIRARLNEQRHHTITVDVDRLNVLESLL